MSSTKMYNLIEGTAPTGTDVVVVQSGTHTALKIKLTNLTKGLANFIADNGTVAGQAGLVPASAIGDAAKGYFLSAAGTFGSPASSLDSVTGTNTSTDGHIALFDGTTGKKIKGSGIASTELGNVTGTTTSTDSHIALFDGTTGKKIKGSGIASTSLVLGTSTSTDGHFVLFDGTSGQVIKDSGIAATELGNVTGTTTSTDDHIALFDGTTGKKIKGSGIALTSLSRIDATDTRSAGVNFQDNIAQRMLLKDSAEVCNSATSSANALTLDCTTGNVFTTTLTENITSLTLSNPPASGNLGTIMWFITQDSTARTITWPGSVIWDSGTAPVLTTVSSKHVITLMSTNAGTTWYGFHSGKDMA